MIMRVITLFRGILASLKVDVSSALLWKDLAEDVIEVRRPLGESVFVAVAVACQKAATQLSLLRCIILASTR